MPSEEDFSPEEKLLKVIQQGKPGIAPSPPRRGPAPAISPTEHTVATAGTVAPKTESISRPVAPAAGRVVTATAGPAVVKSVAGAERAGVAVSAGEARIAAPAAGRRAGDQRPAINPAPAEAGEKKLTLQAKGTEARPVPKSLGTVTATVHPEALQSGIRVRSRATAGASLRIVNRGLGIAAVLLFVVVVLELFAAKPVLPKPPENAGSPFKVMGSIVLPQPETNYLNLRTLIGDPLSANSTNTPDVRGVKGPAALVQIVNYLTENIKIEGNGVSGTDDAAQAFVSITEKGSTRYLRIGGSLSVPVDGKQEKITLDRIQRETLIFLFGKEEVLFKGAK